MRRWFTFLKNFSRVCFCVETLLIVAKLEGFALRLVENEKVIAEI